MHKNTDDRLFVFPKTIGIFNRNGQRFFDSVGLKYICARQYFIPNWDSVYVSFT